MMSGGDTLIKYVDFYIIMLIQMEKHFPRGGHNPLTVPLVAALSARNRGGTVWNGETRRGEPTTPGFPTATNKMRY